MVIPLTKNIYIVKGCKGGCLLRIGELAFYIIHLKRKPWWAILHSFSQTSDMAIAGNAPWKNMQWYIEIYTVLGLHGISILFYQKFITCTGEKKLIHHGSWVIHHFDHLFADARKNQGGCCHVLKFPFNFRYINIDPNIQQKTPKKQDNIWVLLPKKYDFLAIKVGVC